MKQLLTRGLEIIPNHKITRMIAEGKGWQLYNTSSSSFALAVVEELYDLWVEKFCLPDGIFEPDLFNDCKVFLSAKNYIISSMEYGPYPEDIGQIEAFSIAFKTATDLFEDANLSDAIYIEEYSLLLPITLETRKEKNEIVYGRWLTGGVNVSIEAFDRVQSIMSWLSPDLLRSSADLAGFSVGTNYENNDGTNKEQESTELDQPIIPGITVDVSNKKTQRFTLIGRPDLELFFNDNIIDIVLNQEQYKRMGISFPGATILYGPPGCGKTYAVERLSEFLGWQRFDIDSSTIASSFIHETSKKISEVFQNAIKAAPSILVIDEMEAFLTNRSMSSVSGTHHVEEVAEFLRRIPEAISKGVLVFAMTNMIDSIDPAILRRGRFDHIIEVKMATAEEIESLLKYRFLELPVDKSVSPTRIAEALDGHPMSDIAFVLREAGRLAVKNNLAEMNDDCFDKALALLPKKEEKRKIGFN